MSQHTTDSLNLTRTETESLKRLLPFVEKHLRDGKDMDEAVRLGHEDLTSFCQELLEGKTDRSQKVREALFEATWNAAH